MKDMVGKEFEVGQEAVYLNAQYGNKIKAFPCTVIKVNPKSIIVKFTGKDWKDWLCYETNRFSDPQNRIIITL